MADLKALAEAIISGNQQEAVRLTQQALDENVPADAILNDGLVAGMSVVGAKFKANEFYVPEVLIAARAMKSAMELLRPVLVETGVEPRGTVVIGTVRGDLHDIGKNLVAMMLEGAGFEVIDLGTDVSPERFVAAVRQYQPQIIGMSALLTTTMPAMAATTQALREAGLREQVKVMVGGAPVTEEYAQRIGADGFARDAASAVRLARSLVDGH